MGRNKAKIAYVDIASRPNFLFDKTASYYDTTAFIIPSDSHFLLGLLNSTVCWFYWKGVSPILRGGFIHLKTQFVEKTPIPAGSENSRSQISQLAAQCQTIAEHRYHLQHNFRRRIADLCPPEREAKLSKKLQAWWQLDFAAFQQETKRLFKTEIPLRERNAWQDYFDAEREKVAESTRELTVLEAQLNREVYALFDLTEEEIELVEANI